jgi:hypothetical protein
VTNEEITNAEEVLRRLDDTIIFDSFVALLDADPRRHDWHDRSLDRIAKFVQDILASIKPLGYSKATALMDEVVNLTQRMRPHLPDPSVGEALFVAFGIFANYLNAHGVQCPCVVSSQSELMKAAERSGATSEDDIDTVIGKVTQYLSTFCIEQ